MAETTSQHQQSAFSNPQNGQTPIDADQVTANDNALRVAYNAHDADGGIHFQSVAASSLPSAGTAGRKYLTTDTLRIFYDTGSVMSEIDYLNKTQGGTVAGNVTFSGTLTGDLTGNADTATALATARDIALTGDVTGSASFDGTGNASITAAIGTGVIVNADINASAAIVDTKLATISTAGKVANTATTATSANTASAIVARDGSGDFAAGVITGTRLNNSGTTITLRGVTYTLPAADGTSGQVLQTNGSGTLSWAAASSGFVTGSGTPGKIPKWSSSSGLTDSLLSESGSIVTVTGGLTVTGNGSFATASVTSTLTVNGVGYTFPASDGSSGYVLSTNGSGTLSWIAAGGLSGSGTTGTLPKWTGSAALGNSLLSESGSDVSVNGNIGVASGRVFKVNGTQVVGPRETGWSPTWQNAASKTASTAGIQNAPSTIDGAAPLAEVQALESLVRALYNAMQTHGLIN